MSITTAQLHSTKLELRLCAGVNTLFAECQRFAMVRICDHGPCWKLSSVNNTTKIIHHLHLQHQFIRHLKILPLNLQLELHIYNPLKHLQWKFFVKIVNSFYLLTIFAKKLNCGGSTGI